MYLKVFHFVLPSAVSLQVGERFTLPSLFAIARGTVKEIRKNYFNGIWAHSYPQRF